MTHARSRRFPAKRMECSQTVLERGPGRRHDKDVLTWGCRRWRVRGLEVSRSLSRHTDQGNLTRRAVIRGSYLRNSLLPLEIERRHVAEKRKSKWAPVGPYVSEKEKENADAQPNNKLIIPTDGILLGLEAVIGLTL